MNSLIVAAGVQMRVIKALVMRNLVKQAQDGVMGIAKMLLRPAIMIILLYVAGRMTKLGPSGFPLFLFILTGYLTWFVFMRIFAALSTREAPRLLSFPQVTLIDIIFAQMLSEVVVYTLVLFGFASIGIIFGNLPFPNDPLGVVLAFWSAGLLGCGLGLIAITIERFTTFLDDFWRYIRRLGHLLSGVFFLAITAPAAVMAWLRWNPLFHSVELIRQSWWAPYHSPIASPLYLVCSIFLLFAIGLAAEWSTRRFEAL